MKDYSSLKIKVLLSDVQSMPTSTMIRFQEMATTYLTRIPLKNTRLLIKLSSYYRLATITIPQVKRTTKHRFKDTMKNCKTWQTALKVN